MILTGEQIRAARAMLRMDQAKLASEARVSVDTVKRLESVDGEPKANPATLFAIRRVFEMCGLDFEAGGIQRNQNRPDLIRQRISGIFERIVDDILRKLIADEPTLFDHGPQYVIDKLSTSELGQVIHGRVLADVVRAAYPILKRSESAPGDRPI